MTTYITQVMKTNVLHTLNRLKGTSYTMNDVDEMIFYASTCEVVTCDGNFHKFPIAELVR